MVGEEVTKFSQKPLKRRRAEQGSFFLFSGWIQFFLWIGPRQRSGDLSGQNNRFAFLSTSTFGDASPFNVSPTAKGEEVGGRVGWEVLYEKPLVGGWAFWQLY